MPYNECPNCGQKSLNVATRCPRCGLPFEAHFIRHQASAPKPSRVPRTVLIIGAVVAIVVTGVVQQRNAAVRPVRLPVTVIDSAPPVRLPSPQPRESVAAVADSAHAAAPASAAPAESLPHAVTDAAPAASSAPAPVAEPIGGDAAKRRYAGTWINVRAARSNHAPVIRILRPGEMVLVDSLEKGWYRVVNDREAPGYVDRRLLATTPPGSP